MFDIGFWELALIGVVALVVIGPERLPAVARGLGKWFGKARYFLNSVKSEIEKEIKADELKKVMEEQTRNSGLHEIIEETRSAGSSMQDELNQAQRDFNKTTRDAEDTMQELDENMTPLDDAPTNKDSSASPKSSDDERK